MEIRFQRTVTYSADLDLKRERSLAKHLGITRRRLEILIEESELFYDHESEVAEWIDAHPEAVAITEEEEPYDWEADL